jgi:cytochrome P450 family 135
MRRSRTLPPGPREPGLVQALRYTWRFPPYTEALHARFGASYTLRLPGLPPTVVTTDRGLVRHMLTGDPLVRRHANDILEPFLGKRSVMLLEPDDHIARRRLLLPPFHGERVKNFTARVRKLVHEDLDTWPVDEPVRVHERARRLTLAVIQSAVLGSEDESLAAELGAILDTMASPAANLGLFAPALQRRAQWNPIAAGVRRLRERLDALATRLVRETRSDPSLASRSDLLAVLARVEDEHGETLPDQVLGDELKTLLIAGHESTATAIAWAADILAHDQAAAARLHEAVSEGDGSYISHAAKEILRLRTVAPITASRTLLEEAVTNGHVLPPGTVVVVDALSLHRDAKLHPDPDLFRPDRFADGGPPPYSYLPFGGGAHRCLGAPLATLELEVALAAIVERFHVEPTGPPEDAIRRGPTLVPARGARIRVRPRREARPSDRSRALASNAD